MKKKIILKKKRYLLLVRAIFCHKNWIEFILFYSDDCTNPPVCQNEGFVKQVDGVCSCECVDGLLGPNCTRVNTSAGTFWQCKTYCIQLCTIHRLKLIQQQKIFRYNSMFYLVYVDQSYVSNVSILIEYN